MQFIQATDGRDLDRECAGVRRFGSQLRELIVSKMRQVRFFKNDATGEIMMALSGTIDGSVDLDIANANAFAILEALDFEADNTGTVTLDLLRARLGDPVVRRRFTVRRIDHYLARLDRLAGIAAHEQEPQLVWA